MTIGRATFRKLNEAHALADRLRTQQGSAAYPLGSADGTDTFDPGQFHHGMPVFLTSASGNGDGSYNWKQAVILPGGVWADAPNAVTDATAGLAFDPGGNNNLLAVDCWLPVWIIPAAFNASSGKQEWTIVGPVQQIGGYGCPSSTTTSSTSSTTTTTGQPCTGSCRWTWNNSTKAWSLSSSTCNTGCQCNNPTYCGNQSCEDTTTYCTAGVPSPPLNCTGTTTSTSSTSSTSTTTTQNPLCTRGCDWSYDNVINKWILVDNYCPGGLFVNALPCWCPTPTGVGACCNTVHFNCVQNVVVTTTTIIPCTGSCYWWCNWTTGQWVWLNAGICTPNATYGCYCTPPSTGCTNQCQCTDAITPCQNTTPIIGSTTQAFTTTTTTGPPTCAQGGCKFQWNGTTWVLISNTCPQQPTGHAPINMCQCNIIPNWNGHDTCETAVMPCNTTTTSTTTSTTSTSSTTSTTTSTTSTTPAPCGNCTFVWQSGAWNLTSNACTGTCGCPAPSTNGTDGESAQTSCATSTSSTTTTCAPSTTQGPQTCGTCFYQCGVNNSGQWVWLPNGSYCTDGCNCNAPDNCYCGPANLGQTLVTNCTAPTTTSTTTSACPSTTTIPLTCSVCYYKCGCSLFGGTFTCSWSLDSIFCTGGCNCSGPPPSCQCTPGYSGQLTATNCQTSTTTSSTTTAGPVCGTCGYLCSGGTWKLSTANCTGGCHCQAPGGSCTNGQTMNTNCA